MKKRRNPQKHNRQSIRLRGWDYTTPGAYFITICTYQRENIFADARFKEIVGNTWQAIPTHSHAQHVRLDEWVVMPNHLHGILILENNVGRGEAIGRGEATRIDGGMEKNPVSELPRPYGGGKLTSGSVGAVIGNFKSLVARRINNVRRTPGGKVWQRGYYDRIIRNERELNAVRQYIQENPLRWEEDRDNLDTLIAQMNLGNG